MSNDDLQRRVTLLEGRLETMSRQLRLALDYMGSDPQSSLTKSRLVLERLVGRVYVDEMGRPPRKPLLGEMLNDNQFTRHVERRILSRMHAVRDMGNLGPHGEEVNADDAARVLRDLCDILDWYLSRSAPVGESLSTSGDEPEVGRSSVEDAGGAAAVVPAPAPGLGNEEDSYSAQSRAPSRAPRRTRRGLLLAAFAATSLAVLVTAVWVGRFAEKPAEAAKAAETKKTEEAAKPKAAEPNKVEAPATKKAEEPAKAAEAKKAEEAPKAAETKKPEEAAKPAEAAAKADPLAAPADVAAPPADAEKTASGLASKVLKKGTGAGHPTTGSVVSVHYTGWTTDGKMFGSSVKRGRPHSLALNSRTIAGWMEGLQLMVVGEKRRLWIPEPMAYGGRPRRPAGMLVFDIELLENR